MSGGSMKRLWSGDDLVAHFTLLSQDRELLQNKTGPTRLGFAVLLKCFQQEGRFPAKHENTLMLQQVLSEPTWRNRLQAEDLRALTPLFYLYVHPYGWFDLDMNTRLPIERPAA